MIVEYIRYRVSPERSGDSEDAYRRGGEVLGASPFLHCLTYGVVGCTDVKAAGS